MWRCAALWLGLFTLGNLILGRLAPVSGGGGADANRWWIDLRPTGAASAALAILGLALVARGWADPLARPVVRHVARLVLLTGAVACLANGVVYLRLLAAGAVDGGPVPLSFLFAGLLIGSARWPVDERAPALIPAALALGALTVAFPLLQMATFGRTDYRRPADAIVVLGARAYTDGRPSHALWDRLRTACELYHELAADGRAPRLVMSGGPIADARPTGVDHETDVMRAVAIRLGVPADAIICDRAGHSTRDTARATEPLLRELRARRVIAVSHAFHLPRVKLAFAQNGRDVLTVPAEETVIMPGLPWMIARESVAWWAYVVGPARF